MIELNSEFNILPLGIGDKGTILVERKAFEKIATGLSDLSDFVVELKRTIFDQNSWMEMLRGALSEYKTLQSSKQDTTKTSVGSAPSLKNKLPSIRTGRRSDTSICKQNSFNGSKNPLKTKTKNARQKKKPGDNRSGAVGGNTVRSSDSETIPSSVFQPAAKDGNEELQEF